MDSFSSMSDALPSTNKALPTQSLYQPGRSRGSSQQSQRGSHFTRGGFSGQRGLGRGRSRPRETHPQPGEDSNRDSSNPSPFSSAWAPNGQTGTRTYTFADPPKGNNFLKGGQSQENQIKDTTTYRDKNQRNQKGQGPKVRNTVDFQPDHTPAEMRVLMAPAGLKRYNREITSRDVIIVGDLFCRPDDKTIYQNLLKEVEENKNHEWKLWHGDNHLIANDKTRRNQSFPTFDMVIGKFRDYFGMDIQATRFNWFRDTTDWKPYHHDAAAVKPEKAAVQNITVAVSFGTEREASFQHATNGSTVNFPLPNGTIYTFCNDVNVIWRHGVPQVHPDKQVPEGRISIVAWGWVDNIINIGCKPLYKK